jgi:hypothetical protein
VIALALGGGQFIDTLLTIFFSPRRTCPSPLYTLFVALLTAARVLSNTRRIVTSESPLPTTD